MAMILEASVGILVEKLIDLAAEKAAMVLGIKDELTKLQLWMDGFKNFLEAAERRRLEDPALNHWVRQLKDVAYDADDIIDLCRIRAAGLLAADQPSSCKRTPVCFNFTLFSCFSSVPHRYRIGKRITSLNVKLEEINKNRSRFKLQESANQNAQPITSVNTRQTSSLVEFDAVGNEIEVAANEFVKLILQEQGGKYRVFAITGMGGIGKTTLAQKIYNNNNIQTQFQIRVWVCVSHSYNEIDLLQQVIRGAGGQYGEATTKSELLPALQSTVREKRVLFLVLDDIWRADVWADLLRNPLQGADAIVRILVTTRDNNVAMEMGAVHTHPVKQLSNSTCWEMLCRKVFIEGKEEEILNLKDIGMQIVEKCSGLPLAIKAIAGVLANKGTSRRSWENVLKNEAWSMGIHLPEELRGALYLSYDDLPSPLKQCFVYCSLFPENYKINRDDLVRLWVAEGFIMEQEDSLVEDVAEEYYNELITRNLLQPIYFCNDARECIMHDLLRSLAKHLSEDESFSGRSVASTFPSTKLRRVSIEKNQENISSITGVIVVQKCLRTLLAFSRTDQVLNDNLLVALGRLRALRINDDHTESIPNSIGDLIHLRYLNLGHTNIRELPDSIGNLTNLQFLNLRYCRSIEALPKSIGDLIHLRDLNLSGTGISELPDSIENLTNLQFLNLNDCRLLVTLPKGITQLHNLRRLDLQSSALSFIPKGIGKLQKLNELSGFVVASPGDQGYCSGLEELSSLYQLRTLSIFNFERAQKGALSLKKLAHLVNLKLFHTSAQDGSHKTDEEITQIEDVFEELCPSPCLEHLHIIEFFGKQYPRWMQSPYFGACLPSLTELMLSDNKLCPQLPPVGELPQLRHLNVKGATAVKSIGSEFLGVGVRKGTDAAGTTAFPKLEILSFYNMRNLKKWTFGKEMEGMEQEGMQSQASPNIVLLSRLKELKITYCPKLKALPKGLELCAMKKLYIQRAHILTKVNNLPNVREQLMLGDNISLERISHLPALQVLTVKDCPALKYVEKLDALQRLELSDKNMEGLPEWLLKLLKERKPDDYDNDDFMFHLNCSESALRRCLKGGPDWSIIESIPRVSAMAIDAKGFLRYTKKPYNYDTNLFCSKSMEPQEK